MHRLITKFLTALLCLLLAPGYTVLPLLAEDENPGDGYTLKEVVILSRHNIRAPLSNEGSVLAKSTPYTWFEWSSAASELSLRGGVLETEMGQYFRKWVVSEDLMTENYHPEENEVRFYANAKQRTIATAQYFSSGFLPVANVRIETNQEYDKMDPVFTPQLTFVNDAYRKDAEEEMRKLIPDFSKQYALLTEVTDYKNSEGYKNGELSDLVNGDTEFILEENAEPGMKGSLKTATSIADALVLQYYEEPDAKKAAFDHDLSIEDWQAISSIKDIYGDILFTAPLISTNIANPLLKEIDSELERNDRKFTFLCGHDSNIASVLAALGITDYSLDNAIESKTPIGSKVVFEKWADSAGTEYIRVRLVYQSVEQLRSTPLLTLENPPMSYVFQFDELTPNQDGLYSMKDFDAFLDEKIAAYDKLKKEYGISSSVPNTGVE